MLSTTKKTKRHTRRVSQTNNFKLPDTNKGELYICPLPEPMGDDIRNTLGTLKKKLKGMIERSKSEELELKKNKNKRKFGRKSKKLNQDNVHVSE